jgi:hypothetical protein
LDRAQPLVNLRRDFFLALLSVPQALRGLINSLLMAEFRVTQGLLICQSGMMQLIIRIVQLM